MADKKNRKSRGMSRRKFLQGFGITSIGIAAGSEGILGAFQSSCAAPQQGRVVGPEAVDFVLDVNGKEVKIKAEPRETLVEVLRDHLGLTGTKIGCDRGACGACTVMLDGKPVNSCLILALDAIGRPIQTIEGIAIDGTLHKIQQAFIEHDAMQCGFCTPGMLISCKHLLDHHPNPSTDEIKMAVSGNLCRCGTYPKVFDAVNAATKV